MRADLWRPMVGVCADVARERDLPLEGENQEDGADRYEQRHAAEAARGRDRRRTRHADSLRSSLYFVKLVYLIKVATASAVFPGEALRLP